MTRGLNGFAKYPSHPAANALASSPDSAYEVTAIIGICLKSGISLDPTGCLVSIDDGKLNIHENEIRALRRRHGDAFLSVDRFDYFEAGIGKQIVENPPIVLGVLDDQYALAHAACLWSVARSGKTILNVEPTPGVDSRPI